MSVVAAGTPAASSGSELLARALQGPGDDREPDATVERILDAARELAAASGIENLTMDDVAARARLGRMTVYRRFGRKDELVQAMVVRDVRRDLAAIAAAIDPDKELPEQVADGFVATLRIAGSNPLLERTLRFEPERILRSLNDPDDPLLGMLRAFGVAQIGAGGPNANGSADREAVAELLVRIGLSFLMIRPSAIAIDDDEVARDLARNLFAPLISR